MYLHREMLDLNVDAVSVDSTWDETEAKISTDPEKLMEEAKAQTDDSGTPNSSVVNTEEAPFSAGDEDSGSTYAKSSDTVHTFNFDLLNKVKAKIGNNIEIDDDSNENSAKSELVTRQLFPVDVVGVVDEIVLGSSSATSSLRPQWLSLSAPESGGGPEFSILQNQKPQKPQVKKSRRGPRSRSSQYRGVTFYRRTGRWESHIWDCGKQVYLGGFDTAHAAARAYDRAAIKFRGVEADINFNISDYEEDREQMKNLTKEEFVHVLRRQNTGLSRGSSRYRGVTLHKCGRWEARTGQFLKAHDKAAIKCNGREAVTYFEPITYQGEIGFDANGGGAESGQNLDLNLRISAPSDDSKGSNENAGNFNLHSRAGKLPDGKRAKVESSIFALMGGQTFHDIPVASNHHAAGPRMYSSFVPHHEGRAVGKTVEGASLPGFSNWAQQTQSHSKVNQVPLFSTAASSGFSSASTAFSNSLLPLNTQNKTAHKFCLRNALGG